MLERDALDLQRRVLRLDPYERHGHRLNSAARVGQKLCLVGLFHLVCKWNPGMGGVFGLV